MHLFDQFVIMPPIFWFVPVIQVKISKDPETAKEDNLQSWNPDIKITKSFLNQNEN